MLNTVLVEPDGLESDSHRSSTEGRQATGGSRRRVIATVAVVVGGLFVVELIDGPVGLPESADDRLIQAHLDAWYGGDFETAQNLRSPERVRTGPSERRARDEVEYQALLQADAQLLDCEELPPATVRCDVAYSNLLSEAVDKPPIVVALQFGIRDGLLLFVAGPYLEDEHLTASFREYANAAFPAEYKDACVEEPNLQTPDCAAFKLSHLSDWAAGAVRMNE